MVLRTSGWYLVLLLLAWRRKTFLLPAPLTLRHRCVSPALAFQPDTQSRSVRRCVHGVYRGIRTATNFRQRSPDLGFRYGMNEIGDGRLAGQCDYTKAVFEITFVRRSIAESRRTSTRNRIVATTIL
jgi:hypothetical protein